MRRDYFKNNRKILRFKTIVLVSNDKFNLERQICKYTKRGKAAGAGKEKRAENRSKRKRREK